MDADGRAPASAPAAGGGTRAPAEVVAALDPATRVRLLSGADFWTTEALPGVGLPSVLLTDGPHGLRKQAGGTDHVGLGDSEPATCFPTAVTLAASWDVELLEQVGAALGAEARAHGVAVLLGPGLNLKRHPAGGRGFEYFSEDPLLSGRLAAAMVRGIQAQGVAACPKHYVANNQESNRMRVDVVVDERTLRELYLAGFETVVAEAGPWALMSSYNRVGGEHVGESRRLLSEVLREQWGFDGLVVSDWFATADRVAGVRAGMDLEMPGTNGTWDGEVVAALDAGTLAQQDVDAACERIVQLVQRVSADATPRPDPASLHDQHHVLARRAAAAGCVLLANDGVLPLASGGRVGVVGAFAEHPRHQGAGSSLVRATRVDDLLSCLRGRDDVAEVAHAPGYDPATGRSSAAQLADAVQVAAAADVVVLVVGLPGAVESEGFDRDDLRLPPDHDRLVETLTAVHDRVVVVLQNGGPVELPWAERPAALLEAWLGGQAGGSALAEVLLGDVEPGGRLAESFPVAVGDLPADADFADHPTQVVHREGPYVGYRFHDSFDVAPRFCFGHGLGYTSWAWGEPQVDGRGTDRTVRVELTNTGPRRGSQVVQVYVHDVESTLHRPEQELKGFSRVTLDPGETAEVAVTLDRRSFAVWDVATAAWLVEAGTFELRVGASSRDLRGRVRIEVDSEDLVTPVAAPVGALATDAELAALGRPVPEPRPLVPYHRDSVIGDLDATAAGRLVARGLRTAAARMAPGGEDEETRRLMEATLAEAPLRMVAMNAGGPRALRVLDGLLATLNHLSRRGVSRRR